MQSGAGRSQMTYDYDQRLTSITYNSITTQMQYDANGARVKKTVGSNPATVYVGKLYECTGASCTKYIFAGDRRLALVSGSAVYYYHGDHLGSSNLVTNSTGTAVQSLLYQPYGATHLKTGSADVHHKYTGQELDDSTGLYFYQARYYDPVLGRFAQADSIVPEPGNPQALNRYAYVLNNPMIYVDPTGHNNLVYHGIQGFQAARRLDWGLWESAKLGFNVAMQDIWTPSSTDARPVIQNLHGTGGVYIIDGTKIAQTPEQRYAGITAALNYPGVYLQEAYKESGKKITPELILASIVHIGGELPNGGHRDGTYHGFSKLSFDSWQSFTDSVGPFIDSVQETAYHLWVTDTIDPLSNWDARVNNAVTAIKGYETRAEFSINDTGTLYATPSFHLPSSSPTYPSWKDPCYSCLQSPKLPGDDLYPFSF